MIRLTDQAMQKVIKQLQQKPAIGIEVGVKKSGCSGYYYTINPLTEIKTNHKLFEQGDLIIAVDKEVSFLLHNLLIDVQKTGLTEKFIFNNPTASATCGCGMSFSVK